MEVRNPPVGARPGTLEISESASHPEITVVSYDADTIEQFRDPDMSEIARQAVAGRKLWVDVQGLGDEALLRQLAEIFSVHSLALEDVVHVPIRPKAEPYDSNLLVVTRMLNRFDARKIEIEQVSLLIGANYVLTFQERLGDVLDPVRQRLQVAQGRIRSLGPDYLGYAILDTIIDAYYPVIETMGDHLEELEERVLSDASPETLRELNAVKGQLLVLRRAVAPQREAINALIRDDNDLIGQTVRVYLRDTYDHIVHTAEAVETARELVNGLMNTYLSVVSNKMNDVMMTLTVVASIFVPLTFLAGIYGMNFEHMPELQVRWAYPLLMTAMFVTAVGMVVYFWRKGWIGRRR